MFRTILDAIHTTENKTMSLFSESLCVVVETTYMSIVMSTMEEN